MNADINKIMNNVPKGFYLEEISVQIVHGEEVVKGIYKKKAEKPKKPKKTIELERSLNDTQIYVLKTLSEKDFIFTTDEKFQELAKKDYGSAKTPRVSECLKKIGVKRNVKKYIEGKTCSVIVITDRKLFIQKLNQLEEINQNDNI